ncbi:hypothetical protein TPA2_gp03 [Tsukamurella phage TPA2]|uniref:hypothetical protein n=1 Tax=Tsukamurella phage TPA2 TaxID=981330 RepID=UPI0001FF8D9A|nr:hypothetical protein TPA2_gp03 [Tsukamurella phage TPA2]ADX31917.1 hypothetical protein [Tsukamurella phage TPA2]
MRGSMTNPTVQVAIVPGVWLRQHTGTMVVQLNAYTFKETRNTGEGWAFVDFHRGVPADCVPLMAEVIPENVEEIATHPTEISVDDFLAQQPDDVPLECPNEGPNGQCDQDARVDHWCTRKGNPIVPYESTWSPDGPSVIDDRPDTD